MSQPNQNRKLSDLIKKPYYLNCCVHLLERFDMLIYLCNRGYKDIAVRFCFWWYLQWRHQTAHCLLQWAEGTSYHDSFLRSHLFLHSRSWFLPVLFVQHIQSEMKDLRNLWEETVNIQMLFYAVCTFFQNWRKKTSLSVSPLPCS